MSAQYCALDPFTLSNSLFVRFETVKPTLNDSKTFRWRLSFYIGYFIFVQAELTVEIKEMAAVKSKIRIKRNKNKLF